MATSVVSNENRQYWLAGSTSLALFYYLIELRSTQSYTLPMAMGVVVADRDEFCQVGSGGGNISSRQGCDRAKWWVFFGSKEVLSPSV
jgi:hypothetical protein